MPAAEPPLPPAPPEPARINRDNLAINVVITFLGVFSILGLSFIFCLLMFRNNEQISNGLSALIALVGTTVGSLGSILAQTRTQPQGPSPASVPVPVPATASAEEGPRPIPPGAVGPAAAPPGATGAPPPARDELSSAANAR